MSTPTGLLMWGQAGVYNAVDDRLTISAVTDSVVGVVRPAIMSAGTGLTINVAAGWLAIASCEDATNAVVGTRRTITLGTADGVAAGPATGAARRDHLWCDTYPDQGEWRLRVVPEPQTVRRAGVSLGVITVRPGANLASQFEFSQNVPTLGSHADMTDYNNNTSTRRQMSTAYPIAPYQVVPMNLFRLRVWGEGVVGNPIRVLYISGNYAAAPILRLNATGMLARRESFDWMAELQYHINLVGDRMRSTLTFTMTRGAAGQGGSVEVQPRHTMSAARVSGAAAAVNRQWQEIMLQGWWGDNTGAGQMLGSRGSSFEIFSTWSHD